MFGLGPTELIIIFVLLFIFFGAKRLPVIGRGLGKAIKEFKSATEDSNKGSKGEDQSSDDPLHLKDQIKKVVPGVREYESIKGKAEKVKRIQRYLSQDGKSK